MSETPSVPPTVQFGTPVHNPAFPVIGGSSPYTQMDYEGMSIREYFAAHAPRMPQPWFRPVMPARPKRHVYNGLLDDSENARLHAEAIVAAEQWDRARDIAAYAQWPWAWADAVLAARGR